MSTTAPPPSAPTTAAPPGRPRDPRIDGAVLQATRDLLEAVGYLQVTIAAIAERAGTTKPAIYRRWPTKAQLVHEAVFPTEGPEVVLAGTDLREDLKGLMAAGLEVLGNPATRAALPGLMAEMVGDPTLHATVLDRFAEGTWGWLDERLRTAVDSGEVRPGVTSAVVLALIGGATFMATTTIPLDGTDAGWVDEVVDVIFRGISP